ncbi:MAG: glutathione S-transferase family protein [Pseudomonadota bacterium]
MKLYIGNRNYSSWSLRVWLTLKVKRVDFEEDLRPFDVENNYADFFEFSPTGKVPVLEVGDQVIWESLAILEHMAEEYPDRQFWPESRTTRSHARAVAQEMHAGFVALRAACPMNMRRKIEALPVDAAVRRDVARVEAIWQDCFERYGGPYLFGTEFGIADGMYAPIVNRLQIYALSTAPAVLKYTDTLTRLEPWQAWAKDAAAESWVLDIDEVYA